MIGNDVIQADLVALLKAAVSVTGLLTSADDIKEDQYQGTNIAYPALRMNLIRQIPYNNRVHCDHALLVFSVRVLTEQASSRQADNIAAAVNAYLRGRQIRGTGWYGWIDSTSVVGARWVGQRLWASEVLFEVNVYPTTAS